MTKERSQLEEQLPRQSLGKGATLAGRTQKQGVASIASMMLGMVIAAVGALVLSYQLFSSFRLYATQELTRSVVLECKQRNVGITSGGAAAFVYAVRVGPTYSDIVPVFMCTNADKGRTVTIVHSPLVQNGSVAVFGAATLWRVIMGSYSGSAIVMLIGSVSIAAYLTWRRALSIILFVRAELRTAFTHIHDKNPAKRLTAYEISDRAGDLAFLIASIVALSLLVFTLLRWLLYVPEHGEISFAALSAGMAATLWSPLPLKLVQWVYKTYTSKVVKTIRNCVFIALLASAIYRLAHLALTEPHNAACDLHAALKADTDTLSGNCSAIETLRFFILRFFGVA